MKTFATTTTDTTTTTTDAATTTTTTDAASAAERLAEIEMRAEVHKAAAAAAKKAAEKLSVALSKKDNPRMSAALHSLPGILTILETKGTGSSKSGIVAALDDIDAGCKDGRIVKNIAEAIELVRPVIAAQAHIASTAGESLSTLQYAAAVLDLLPSKGEIRRGFRDSNFNL